MQWYQADEQLHTCDPRCPLIRREELICSPGILVEPEARIGDFDMIKCG